MGNHPPFASVEACDIKGDIDESTQWTEILGKSSLEPGSQNFFEINNSQQWTHMYDSTSIPMEVSQGLEYTERLKRTGKISDR